MPAVDPYGVGHTPEQVGPFLDVSQERVAEYLVDVLDSAQPVSRGLAATDLETTNPDRNPLQSRSPSTVAWVLAGISAECSQHIG